MQYTEEYLNDIYNQQLSINNLKTKTMTTTNKTQVENFKNETIISLNNFVDNLDLRVDNSLGSLFTKDDVKKILNELKYKLNDVITTRELVLEEEVKRSHSNLDFKKLQNDLDDILHDALENNHSTSNYELEDVSFQLNYDNRVELDDYTITPDWSSIVKDITAEVFDEICKSLDVYEEKDCE